MRLTELSPEEFFSIIHPIVSQDEWKLIAVGAVLGFCAGLIQVSMRPDWLY